jgi:hypothetical protein
LSRTAAIAAGVQGSGIEADALHFFCALLQGGGIDADA